MNFYVGIYYELAIASFYDNEHNLFSRTPKIM